jgi:hypothetical protein
MSARASPGARPSSGGRRLDVPLWVACCEIAGPIVEDAQAEARANDQVSTRRKRPPRLATRAAGAGRGRGTPAHGGDLHREGRQRNPDDTRGPSASSVAAQRSNARGSSQTARREGGDRPPGPWTARAVARAAPPERGSRPGCRRRAPRSPGARLPRPSRRSCATGSRGTRAEARRPRGRRARACRGPGRRAPPRSPTATRRPPWTRARRPRAPPRRPPGSSEPRGRPRAGSGPTRPAGHGAPVPSPHRPPWDGRPWHS